MRRHAPSRFLDDRVNRRSFLTITGLASATTILGGFPLGRLASAAALTKEQRDQLRPDDIIALMKKGNERFRLGQESPHDYLAQQKASARVNIPPP
jgi:carbonic anhydrase